MDIKQQCIIEYLTQGTGYRQLAKKYGVSKTTINKWVMIHQGIHNLLLIQKQMQYNSSATNSSKQKSIATQYYGKTFGLVCGCCVFFEITLQV